ncbi:tRNA epoxyqueuosine(34) reductase QueG [Sandaracinobacteroides saxicola]|uniref:tRNA epoxyqueuosine(34) reductase QueG n=1 Tax=Sandaracinobacteroides saxicola TaxID=2759707 RepID=A0A7G5IFG0_9SPHN|nr:tRNA epoxyqueuosine(34) reductase QueG [Sandaracinobacteroides saxicola]QMW22102.1 tRNA epoxyqueuosine(34) reductase QueG [Sandaracinobacteroides saxicola]
MTSSTFNGALRREAEGQGFVAVGVCGADAAPAAGARLRAWLAAGCHGDMLWMERPERESPRALWADVRSVVVLGFPYTPVVDPLRHAGSPEVGVVSVYALGADYHDLVKRRLKAVAGWLARETGAALKVFVDTAPVMEKALAAAAGIGWQGKHSNVVSRRHGSWLFLAAIYSEAVLEPFGDDGSVASCGTCSACIAACPTEAIVAPHVVDARKCISYLTIEHKGPIPPVLRAAMGNRVYGCDDCLAVCPWNRFARAPSEFVPRGELLAPDLGDLLALDDAAFRQLFAGSPVKRIGRGRLVRNAAVAAGNSGALRFLPALRRLMGDTDAVVAEAAGWAVGRLED